MSISSPGTGPADRPSRPDVRPPAGVLALRRPADLVEAVPYLIGFHPHESLVLVGLDRGPGRSTRVGVVARIDLADLAGPSDGPGAGLLHRTVRAVARPQTHGLVALIHRDAAEPDTCPACTSSVPDRRHPTGPETACDHVTVDPEWFDAVDDAVDAAGLVLVDLLVVGPDRWVSVLCEDPDCEGCEGPLDRSSPSSTAVQATVAGLVARPNRQEVEALLDPLPAREGLRADLDAAADLRLGLGGRERERRRRSEIRALFAATRVLPVLDDETVIRFGVALGDISVRDSCWLAVDAGRVDGDDLWRQLARRLPSPYDGPALFLTGWTQWRAGNGTLAGIAAQRALESDPEYHAAELLATALHHGLDPFHTPRLRRGPRGPLIA